MYISFVNYLPINFTIVTSASKHCIIAINDLLIIAVVKVTVYF